MTQTAAGKKKPAWIRPTTRAERALQAAQECARQDGGGLAGPHHLLLALVQEPRSASALLLDRLGVSPQAVGDEVRRAAATARVEERRRPTEDDWARGRAALLEPARAEALRLGTAHVGTEHLLLGLVNDGGVAGQALHSLGLTRERVSAALAAGRPPPAPAAETVPGDPGERAAA